MREIRILSITLLALAALLSGCGSAPVQPNSGAAPIARPLVDTNSVRQALYAQYHEWKGVRYRDGGLSKDGVDCSGFVFLTYSERFGIILPRSTEGQVLAGPEIPEHNLEPGDLVFFKTGWKIHHVGIYLEDGEFLHVSSTHGVMISHLDNVYWSRNYWKAVRINPDSGAVSYSHY